MHWAGRWELEYTRRFFREDQKDGRWARPTAMGDEALERTGMEELGGISSLLRVSSYSFSILLFQSRNSNFPSLVPINTTVTTAPDASRSGEVGSEGSSIPDRGGYGGGTLGTKKGWRTRRGAGPLWGSRSCLVPSHPFLASHFKWIHLSTYCFLLSW